MEQHCPVAAAGDAKPDTLFGTFFLLSASLDTGSKRFGPSRISFLQAYWQGGTETSVAGWDSPSGHY